MVSKPCEVQSQGPKCLQGDEKLVCRYALQTGQNAMLASACNVLVCLRLAHLYEGAWCLSKALVARSPAGLRYQQAADGRRALFHLGSLSCQLQAWQRNAARQTP